MAPEYPVPVSDSHVQRCLAKASELLGCAVKLDREIGGGDVAEAFRIKRDDGTLVFMKTHRNPPPDFFRTEAAGLGWMRESNSVAIPEVLGVSEDPALLVMDWIEPGRPNGNTESALGYALAELHRSTASNFGRPDGKTTGSLGLPNETDITWAAFLATNRLLPLARIASDRGSLPAGCIRSLESLAQKLDRLDVPEEPPALLHGDLWAGNRLVDANGVSWLIDPACYYGHREADLAMMRLFGGFGDECFNAYQDHYPLAAGFESRIALHQIPPLVVHAIKFGGGYVDESIRAIRQFC